jgi:hypothetical protein
MLSLNEYIKDKRNGQYIGNVLLFMASSEYVAYMPRDLSLSSLFYPSAHGVTEVVVDISEATD